MAYRFGKDGHGEVIAEERAAKGQAWLETYLTSSADLGVRIEQAVAGGNRSELRAAAHRLAGASLSAGTTSLGELARGLEAAAPNGTEQEIDELMAATVLELRGAQEAIRSFIAGLGIAGLGIAGLAPVP